MVVKQAFEGWKWKYRFDNMRDRVSGIGSERSLDGSGTTVTNDQVKLVEMAWEMDGGSSTVDEVRQLDIV